MRHTDTHRHTPTQTLQCNEVANLNAFCQCLRENVSFASVFALFSFLSSFDFYFLCCKSGLNAIARDMCVCVRAQVHCKSKIKINNIVELYRKLKAAKVHCVGVCVCVVCTVAMPACNVDL